MEENRTYDQKTTAFTGVTVIPMDAERLLESHTVIIEGTRIAAIGPDESIDLPTNADIVEGQGAYLLPGLANMHAHLMGFDPDPRHLALYLAGGVTTVRSLNTHKEIFTWRQKSAQADWIGPTILMSGPVIVDFPPDYRLMAFFLRAAVVIAVLLVSALLLAGAILVVRFLGDAAMAAEFARRWAGPWLVIGALAGIGAVWWKLIPLRRLASLFLPMASIVETPAQARAEVRRQAEAGVDCVKVYDYLDRETYIAALQTARKAGVYSIGHIPEDPDFVPVEAALEAGLNDVAHVDELTHEFLIGYKPGSRDWMEWEIDMEKVNKIAGQVASHGAAVTATLVTNETVLLGLEDIGTLLQRPEYTRIKAETITKWKSGGRMVRWQGQERYRRENLRPLWMALTKALHQAGVAILLGTDSDVEGIVPGFSEHRELELLVEAGLTPFEALAAATCNPARIAGRMHAESSWGTIEVGNRADLILLSDDPFEDIRNSRSILGVMARGHWLTQAELNQNIVDYLDGS